MTIFEKFKNACESKEVLAKMINGLTFSCCFCSKNQWCIGLIDVPEKFCVSGIMEWLDKEADDEPK